MIKLYAGPAGGATRMITVMIQCKNSLKMSQPRQVCLKISTIMRILLTDAAGVLKGLLEAQKRLQGSKPSFASSETNVKQYSWLNHAWIYLDLLGPAKSWRPRRSRGYLRKQRRAKTSRLHCFRIRCERRDPPQWPPTWLSRSSEWLQNMPPVFQLKHGNQPRHTAGSGKVGHDTHIRQDIEKCNASDGQRTSNCKGLPRIGNFS
jgi:hypothetical protein